MASILDKYGIKEVCDFTFYALGNDGAPTVPVLYCDTLKVSTVEQTGDLVEAKGGKGNATLIAWDGPKELTVTLEDALFSAKSMAILFGGGKYAQVDGTDADSSIMRTEQNTFAVGVGTTVDMDKLKSYFFTSTTVESTTSWYASINGKKYKIDNPKFYTPEEIEITSSNIATLIKAPTAGDPISYTVLCTYDVKIKEATIIEISPNTFPGTYYCVGDKIA